MRRSIKVTIIKGSAIRTVDGQPQARELEPVHYNGRKLTDVGMEKLFKKQLESDERVFITGVEDKEQTYELSLEDFLEVATLVEE